jgi:hypothetical protein
MRLRDEPEVVDVSALRMREATIVAGIWMTYGVGGLGMLYSCSHGTGPTVWS